MDLEDAYAIQLRGVQTAVQAGQRVIGYKIGLTSSAMQQQFDVLEPDFGHLLDSMAVPEAGVVRPAVEIALPTIAAMGFIYLAVTLSMFGRQALRQVDVPAGR